MFFLKFNSYAQDNVVPNVLHQQDDSSYIYESYIHFRGNTLGGILITKKIEDSIRITLSSKFGMKIFDYMLTKDSIQTLYSIPQLERKIIKKTFYTDFKMIYPFLFSKICIKKKKKYTRLKSRCKKFTYQYTDGNIEKIRRGCSTNKVELKYKKDDFKNLSIFHPLIGLKIEIKPLILLNE